MSSMHTMYFSRFQKRRLLNVFVHYNGTLLQQLIFKKNRYCTWASRLKLQKGSLSFPEDESRIYPKFILESRVAYGESNLWAKTKKASENKNLQRASRSSSIPRHILAQWYLPRAFACRACQRLLLVCYMHLKTNFIRRSLDVALSMAIMDLYANLQANVFSWKNKKVNNILSPSVHCVLTILTLLFEPLGF